jgi:hypothetical protein
MPDIIDQAQQFDALNLAQGLQAQQAKAALAPKLSPKGYCLNPRCSEDFDEGSQQLFCGPACAREHHQLTTNR